MGLGSMEKTEGEDEREQVKGRGTGPHISSDPGICVNGGFLSNQLETEVWEQGEPTQAVVR